MEAREHQEESLKAHFRESYGREATPRDIRYHTILTSLVRHKRKTRVRPSLDDSWRNRDYMWKAQVPDGRGELAKETSSPNYPYRCASDCETCFNQCFPALLHVSDAEAQSKLNQLVSSIDTDMAFLCTAIAHHADFLLTRWKKKKKKKKKKTLAQCSQVLSTLYPDAPSPFAKHASNVKAGLHGAKWAPVHLIDLRSDKSLSFDDSRFKYPGIGWNSIRSAIMDYLVMSSVEDVVLEERKVSNQTTWLLPYLDVESLSEDPLLLLSLLHFRTACTPEEWMMFDNLNLKLSEHYIVLVNELNPNSVLMTGPAYGRKLVTSDKTQNHRWEAVRYLKAQYILTAQQKMTNFLRRTVECILNDRPPANSPLESVIGETDISRAKPSPKWDQLVRNKFLSFGHAEANFIRACAVRPFWQPPHFDPLATQEMVRSMCKASADELDMAQTDPQYLQHLIRKLKAATFLKKMDSDQRWTTWIDEFLMNFYRRFIWLDATDAARKQLNTVWTCFRRGLLASQKKDRFPQEFLVEYQAAFSAANRQDYIDLIEDERRAVIAALEKRHKVLTEKSSNIQSTIVSQAAQTGPGNFTALSLRNKTKTRPDKTASRAEPVLADIRAHTASTATNTTFTDVTAPRLCIPVKHENIGVFRALFRTDNGTTRSFSWKHLLQAIVDADFALTQSSGSAVGFKNDKGYIIFHSPHPEPIIEPVVLFAMGKRLRRRFGWSAECLLSWEMKPRRGTSLCEQDYEWNY